MIKKASGFTLVTAIFLLSVVDVLSVYMINARVVHQATLARKIHGVSLRRPVHGDAGCGAFFFVQNVFVIH